MHRSSWNAKSSVRSVTGSRPSRFASAKCNRRDRSSFLFPTHTGSMPGSHRWTSISTAWRIRSARSARMAAGLKKVIQTERAAKQSTARKALHSANAGHRGAGSLLSRDRRRRGVVVPEEGEAFSAGNSSDTSKSNAGRNASWPDTPQGGSRGHQSGTDFPASGRISASVAFARCVDIFTHSLASGDAGCRDAAERIQPCGGGRADSPG